MKLTARLSSEQSAIVLLVFILLCARLVSFAYLSYLSAHNPSSYPYPIVSGDSIHYAHLADTLFNRQVYQWVPGVPYRGAPPGYPALLAGMRAATGSTTGVLLIQVPLALLAVILIYRIGRTLLPPGYALVPALVYAIDPLVAFTDTAVLTDGLVSALVVCVVYLAFFQKSPHYLIRWAAAGALLGVAMMIRPITEFLFIVFPALYLWRGWMHGVREERSRLKAICVFIVTCTVIVAPWMVRNQIYLGSFEVSNIGSDDLLRNDARGFLAWRALSLSPRPMSALMVMRSTNDPIFATVDRKIDQDLARITPHGEDPLNYEGRLAVSYILHDPVRYAYFHAVNTLPFFLSSSIASYEQVAGQIGYNEAFYAPTSLSLLTALHELRHPRSVRSFMSTAWSMTPTGLEIVWWILVLSLGLMGVITWRKNSTVVLCAVLVLYFAVLTGPMSASRYRIPAEPYLLVLAAVGLYTMTHRNSRRSAPLASAMH